MTIKADSAMIGRLMELSGEKMSKLLKNLLKITESRIKLQ